MTDEESLAAIEALFRKRVQLNADAFEFFEIVVAVQIAYRHPRMPRGQKQRMRNYIERIKPIFIALGGPGIGQLIDRGWQENAPEDE
jgi:hypothetical protein